jgi:gas vesicle protein
MSDRDDFGAFLVGFIIGGVTGAVTALLLAPQTGEETRTLIRSKAIELRDIAGESLDDAYAQAEAAAVEARTRFDDLAKMTREHAVDLQQRGQVVLEEQKAKLTEALPKKKSTSKPAEGEAPAA